MSFYKFAFLKYYILHYLHIDILTISYCHTFFLERMKMNMKKKLLNLSLALFLVISTFVVTNNTVTADSLPVPGVTITKAELTVDSTPIESEKNGNRFYAFNVTDFSLSFSDNKTTVSDVDASPGVRCNFDKDGNPSYEVYLDCFTPDGNSVYYASDTCEIFVNGVQIGISRNKYIGGGIFSQDEIAPSGLLIPIEFVPGADGTIYRLLFPPTNKHLYSTDVNECRSLCAAGWVQETSPGISATSGVGIYRLYNPATDEHLFTADTNERDTLASKNGWKIDNGGKPIFYGVESGTPVYRLYNPTVPTVASHHYTSDKNEINVLLGAKWQYDNGGNPVYYLK